MAASTALNLDDLIIARGPLAQRRGGSGTAATATGGGGGGVAGVGGGSFFGSASSSSSASLEDKFALLTRPLDMNDVQDVFEELYDFPAYRIHSKGSSAGGRGRRRDGSDCMLRCLGHLTKAAVQGSPVLIVMPNINRPEAAEFYHMADVVAILDEVHLGKATHFVLETHNGKGSIRFSAKTSFAYTEWMQALRSSILIGGQARKTGLDRMASMLLHGSSTVNYRNKSVASPSPSPSSPVASTPTPDIKQKKSIRTLASFASLTGSRKSAPPPAQSTSAVAADVNQSLHPPSSVTGAPAANIFVSSPTYSTDILVQDAVYSWSHNPDNLARITSNANAAHNFGTLDSRVSATSSNSTGTKTASMISVEAPLPELPSFTSAHSNPTYNEFSEPTAENGPSSSSSSSLKINVGSAPIVVYEPFSVPVTANPAINATPVIVLPATTLPISMDKELPIISIEAVQPQLSPNDIAVTRQDSSSTNASMMLRMTSLDGVERELSTSASPSSAVVSVESTNSIALEATLDGPVDMARDNTIKASEMRKLSPSVNVGPAQTISAENSKSVSDLIAVANEVPETIKPVANDTKTDQQVTNADTQPTTLNVSSGDITNTLEKLTAGSAEVTKPINRSTTTAAAAAAKDATSPLGYFGSLLMRFTGTHHEVPAVSSAKPAAKTENALENTPLTTTVAVSKEVETVSDVKTAASSTPSSPPSKIPVPVASVQVSPASTAQDAPAKEVPSNTSSEKTTTATTTKTTVAVVVRKKSTGAVIPAAPQPSSTTQTPPQPTTKAADNMNPPPTWSLTPHPNVPSATNTSISVQLKSVAYYLPKGASITQGGVLKGQVWVRNLAFDKVIKVAGITAQYLEKASDEFEVWTFEGTGIGFGSIISVLYEVRGQKYHDAGIYVIGQGAV